MNGKRVKNEILLSTRNKKLSHVKKVKEICVTRFAEPENSQHFNANKMNSIETWFL